MRKYEKRIKKIKKNLENEKEKWGMKDDENEKSRQ